MRNSIFPDHTAKVTPAKAAFKEVRKQLPGMRGYILFYLTQLQISYGGVEKGLCVSEDAEGICQEDGHWVMFLDGILQ